MIKKGLIDKFIIRNGVKCFFFREIFHNYLVFVPVKRCIKYFSGSTQIGS